MKFKYSDMFAIALLATVLSGCGENPKPPESTPAGGMTPEQIKWNAVIMCQQAAATNPDVKCETR